MKNCIYPHCLLTECLQPHCQRSRPKQKNKYTTIIGIIIIIAFWSFIYYIINNIK